MFVKKLVEKASRKHTKAGINGLRPEDVNPRLVFHYGLPPESSAMGYDPIHRILAVATRNGQIKLFGRDNTQALLQSDAALPTKFLQFMDNQGILFNVTTQNHIEVWDIDVQRLCYVHIFNDEITSFTVLQQSLYIYAGDCSGNISLLKLDHEQKHLITMPYKIPFSESYGMITAAGHGTAVICALPQPMAENKRVLIIFMDGLISLWDIQTSTTVFVCGRSMQNSSQHDPKTVVSACWACAHGSKVVLGYSSGDIFVWSIPVLSDGKNSTVTDKKELNVTQNVPLLKLNLGYKMDKVPIVSLRCVIGDGRTSRLYINGFSDHESSCSFQVLILNETSESRTIKFVLPLTEACLAMELITCFSEENKHKQNALVLLLKSGHLCLYDDSEIERYLIRCQSKSPPTLPNQLMMRLPFGESGITAANLYTSNSAQSSAIDEDYISLANKYSYFLSVNTKEKNKNCLSSTNFSQVSKTKSLYITGHHDGAINFWDASCPLLLLILSIKQQNEDSTSPSSCPVTSLHFDSSSKVLVAGDRSGQIRIITFKKEHLASDCIFSFLQGKPGQNYSVCSIKLKGAIVSTSVNPDSKHLAVGTDKGFVAVINIEEGTILYQKQCQSRIYSGVVSLQFETYAQDGFDKNVLLVAMEDSSVLALEVDTGNQLSTSLVCTKKPSRALLMQILDVSSEAAWASDCQDINKENSFGERASKHSLLLLCSENAVRLYSLSHAIQGIKRLVGKKKISSNCCYTSVVNGPSSDVGLVLLFSSGKIEIRSLPDLTLLKEASLRGFTCSKQNSSSASLGALSASTDGELVMVKGDQEILFFSILSRNDIYRHLEYINLVYKKDLALQEESSYVMNASKEKKKGIFGMVVKDQKGSKQKQSQEMGPEDSTAINSKELFAIFSIANFPPDSGGGINTIEDDGHAELDIDDIDLEDSKQKHKGPNFAALSRKKLGKGLLALKGKLMTKTEENVNSGKNESGDEIVMGSVDQIKMKYGYAVNNDSGAAKIARDKLKENARKLEATSMRTSEMENNAQTFSSLAKDLLRTVKNGTD
ncbi:uncharacterized protein [Typha angustifolia]|uniref:uncharacterized protein isoform X2 n=1 Tax=Typha angustifolia TaxID=59011 RepID=UPI003C2C5D7D